MNQLVKTTITIPEDLLQTVKLTAVHSKTTFSHVIRDALEDYIRKPKKQKIVKKDPMRLLGKFKLGIKVPYKNRSDLYDEHLQRKMGIRF